MKNIAKPKVVAESLFFTIVLNKKVKLTKLSANNSRRKKYNPKALFKKLNLCYHKWELKNCYLLNWKMQPEIINKNTLQVLKKDKVRNHEVQ